MPSPLDVPVLMRAFAGVDVATDPAFLDPSMLQAAQNFVPSLGFGPTKRQGTATYLTVTGTDASGLRALFLAVADNTGHYLFAAGPQAGVDVLSVSKNGAAFAAVAGAPTITTNGVQWGFAQWGNTVYAGNGVNPIKRIPLVDAITATDLTPLTLANDTGQAAVIGADATSTLLTGTYQYRWCVYDGTAATQKWTHVGPVESVVVTATGPSTQTITFTAPQVAAPATQVNGNGGSPAATRWHLFVAPANLPIEAATDQTANGLVPAATYLMQGLTTDGTPVPVPSTVTRTGNILIPRRGRLYVAGDAANPRSVYATDVLLPGLEQAIFNQGNFFPAYAFLTVDAPVTAMALMAQSSAAATNPDAPLAILTATGTWALFGDILDDPNAALLQVSRHIGAVHAEAVDYTPLGPVFVGQDSVYLLPPSLSDPLDIGRPIWPVIRSIPVAQRVKTRVVYHKGFLKVALVPAGQTTATQEWWLDCRFGIDPAHPSWWGPHTGGPYTCFAQSDLEVAEFDRAWGAVAGGGIIRLLDQTGSYVDGSTAIVSLLHGARTTSGEPFRQKSLTRLRAMVRATAPTTVEFAAIADAGTQLALPAAQAFGANTIDWNEPLGVIVTWEQPAGTDITWATTPIYVEAEAISPNQRPRGMSLEWTLTHRDAVQLDVRDVEMRYLPSERDV